MHGMNIEISTTSSATHLLTLYFLDSGSYSKGYFDWFGYFFPTEYDWIHEARAFLDCHHTVSAF